MTQQESEALDWAISRLKACREDSEKMAKRVVSCTALDNIRHYDNLCALRDKLVESQAKQNTGLQLALTAHFKESGLM